MAGLTWIFFGLCAVSCSAQFGYNIGDNPFIRQKSQDFQRQRDPLLKAFQISENDHKCFTIARRPFYMTRPMQYPCNRRTNGIPVVHSFQSPFGPMCVSLFREPVHRYYKIELCCPGFTTDRNGQCSIPTGGNKIVREQLQQHQEQMQQRQEQLKQQQEQMQQRQEQLQQQEQQRRNMMAMAAQMRNMVWLRAKAAMAKKRAMMMSRMQRQMMMPQRPTMPMPPMMHKMMDRAFSRGPPMFNRPQLPLPSPRPVQRPPLNGRFIHLLQNAMQRPIIVSKAFRVPVVPAAISVTLRQPTRMVLSNRAPDDRANLEKLHPMEPAIPRPPQIPIPQDFQQQRGEFSQYPEDADTMVINDGFSPEGDFQSSEMQTGPDMRVNLPDSPVDMPQLIVEQAPLSDGEQTSCIMTLNSAVKSCLKQNKIDVPDVMSAFGPFNEEMSAVLCEREEAIFTCISDALKACNTSDDAQMATDMLQETADTVGAMCVHQEMMIGESDASMSQDLITASQSNEATSANVADTMATVENVDDIPTDQGTQPEQITVVEDSAPPAATASADDSIQQAIRHEVRAQEIEMKEYYLPLLIGSGVGFMILVLVTAMLICCCCRRKLTKKMKMAKEMEKPPLRDEIYTIGIAPPTYEVNGIPPMYYEEAKGEKISSKSPAVLQGEDAPAGDLGEGTQM